MHFPWKSAVLWNAICRKIKIVYILQSCIKMIFTALVLFFWLWMNALLNKLKQRVTDWSGLYPYLCHQHINWTCEKMMDKHCRKPHSWHIHVAFLCKWCLNEPNKYKLWSPRRLTGNTVSVHIDGQQPGEESCLVQGETVKERMLCFVARPLFF